MLAQIVDRNETFLGYAQNSLKMFKRLDKSPDDLQDLLVELVEATGKLRVEKPEDRVATGIKFVQKFLDAGLERLKTKTD